MGYVCHCQRRPHCLKAKLLTGFQTLFSPLWGQCCKPWPTMTSRHINKLDMGINKCLVKSSYDLTITSRWRHTVKWINTTIHPAARSKQNCIWHVFTSRITGLSMKKAPQKKYWNAFSLRCSLIHCSQQRVKIPHRSFRARKDVAMPRL